MAQSHILAETLDDLMRKVVTEINLNGSAVSTTRGSIVEITGILLQLSNPRARLSRTETRGKPYSCLGELCWYLAGSNQVDFITYYIPAYRIEAEGDIIWGGYGPRLRGWKDVDQLANVIALLRRRTTSRRAVIQLFDASDIANDHKDIPCTCTLQFMIRQKRLHLLVSMRSNDVYLGLPHDVFCFTMLHEIVARCVSVEVGTYKHFVGSLHLYEQSRSTIQRFLDEGWQSTLAPMPPMPVGDPWPAISTLLESESRIRQGLEVPEQVANELEPYWADLIRLLRVLSCKKNGRVDEATALRQAMSSDTYEPYMSKLTVR